MEKYRKWGLWLRIALPFLLFVVAGSIVLCAWLYTSARRDSRNLFGVLARTNADFIRTSKLPASERMAFELSRILDVQVYFRSAEGAIIPEFAGNAAATRESIDRITPAMGVVELEPPYEGIVTPIDATHDLILIRAVRDSALLLRPATMIVLASFWTLSLVLAWTLTRGVVRPLRILALRLPQIESDASFPRLPGIDRNDEIGLLARTYRDTHVQLMAERERREKSERLAMLGKMATGLAHEINNPLSSIRMHIQLMQSAKPQDLAGSEAIPLILGETSKIESLVNQWMFLAKPAPPQSSPADLGELVRGVVKTILPQAQHARVTIQETVPMNLRANVDARRVRQAMGNIIVNAIQAMPNGGTLQISGRNGADARLIFQDAGPGFSENALRHYADLFYSEKEGGMGIGLSVSSEIVRAHGGSIEINNRPDSGATVSLIFPIVKESE
jgi:signal transduction histidine kinase